VDRLKVWKLLFFLLKHSDRKEIFIIYKKGKHNNIGVIHLEMVCWIFTTPKRWIRLVLPWLVKIAMKAVRTAVDYHHKTTTSRLFASRDYAGFDVDWGCRQKTNHILLCKATGLSDGSARSIRQSGVRLHQVDRDSELRKDRDSTVHTISMYDTDPLRALPRSCG